ncbi:hypothetical protein [Dyella sp. C9]|uniref:hypothetical protein n=1 Tax=Dyella sp. C9 TaxID=2202154 RepID=UPI001300AB96|nr:hypothetical protein [Dyella sp. C9]
MKRIQAMFSAIALLIFAATISLHTPPLHAQALVSVTCALGVDDATYSPGLTNTSQTITFNDNQLLANCVDTGDLTLNGGSEQSSGSYVGSCTAITMPGPYQAVFHWNNAAQSISVVQVTQAVVTKVADGTATVERTGTVASGLAQGAAFVQVIALPVLDPLLCSSSTGVVSNSGTVVSTELLSL